MEYCVVPFALVTSVPFDVIKRHADTGQSIRLKPPFAEHLAHRFGTMFSRVALPENAYDDERYKRFIESLNPPKGP